jgi:hypothetical protein
LFKQYLTHIYINRDFYYPRFIQMLCASLLIIFFTKMISHPLFEEIVIIFSALFPSAIIVTTYIGWVYKNGNKVK